MSYKIVVADIQVADLAAFRRHSGDYPDGSLLGYSSGVALSAPVALEANCVAIIPLAFGCIVAGVMIDRFGACKIFIAGFALLAIAS